MQLRVERAVGVSWTPRTGASARTPGACGLPGPQWRQRTSTVIQRVLVKVNGEVFTQKDLEDKQIEALQQQNKGDLQGERADQGASDLMPDLLVSAVDEMLILQRGKSSATT